MLILLSATHLGIGIGAETPKIVPLQVAGSLVHVIPYLNPVRWDLSPNRYPL